MKRILVGITLLCTPVAGRAQYLQNISTSEYSLRTLLTKETNFSYLYQVQFPYEQLFTPDAKSYHITDVLVHGVGGVDFIPGQHEQYLPWTRVGAVYTNTLAGPPLAHPIVFRPSWFDILNDNGSLTKRFGGSFTSASIQEGAGLLGCTVPALGFIADTPDNYAGSTCSSAGFTGWAQINIRLTFDVAKPDFNGSSLSADVYGFFSQRVAVNIVPEPSTWVLMLTGLGIVGMVARKRS